MNKSTTVMMPLLRKMVAKNRSSCGPNRSRTTPVNHRKAIPAKGNKVSTRETVLDQDASQSVVISSGLTLAILVVRAMMVISRTEKTMPAIAAARGDLSSRWITCSGF
jgi:hypothetical protein